VAGSVGQGSDYRPALWRIDTTDPSSQLVELPITKVDFDLAPIVIAATGSHVAVAGERGLWLFDAPDTGPVREVDSLDLNTTCWPHTLVASGDWLYLSSGGGECSGLRLFDMSAARGLREVTPEGGLLAGRGSMTGPAFAGGLLYLPEYQRLTVWDVSEPTRPELVADVGADWDWYPYAVAVEGDLVAVTDREAGFRLLHWR
jgi:hypothetical protein